MTKQPRTTPEPSRDEFTPETRAAWLKHHGCVTEVGELSVAAAIREAEQSTREACMAAMCEGCREGWDVERNVYSETIDHVLPNGITRQICLAQPIREMTDGN